MLKTVDINVHHVTRVEGHGNIVVRASDGKIEKVEWQVPEAPRFFEAMVRGRRWDEIQEIVSRVCGICSISHSFAAVKAVEAALGVEISDDVKTLRTLAHYSEMFQSHVLHVGYLVAPDLLGVKSVIPLASTHLDVVKKIVSLHRAANDWSDLLAGRTTHPITFVPGGFSAVPSQAQLSALRERLAGLVPTAVEVAEVVLSLAGKVPVFDRETEYVALKAPGIYAMYDGAIASSDMKDLTPVDKFESVVNEYVTPQSTAKWCKWHRDSFAVGALARYNLNADRLSPLAKKWAGMFGLGAKVTNPYLNTVVQLVEAAHVLEHGLQILDDLLAKPRKFERTPVKVKAGNGAASVEAPRGILFHRYVFDDKGVCQKANMVIPTNQNHANMQKDFEKIVPTLLDLPQDEIRLRLEMLIRAYDPCVSCSTHFLNVEFI